MSDTPRPQDTVDTFARSVQLDEHRVILVYHRQHAGRCFVRWRTWHKHRVKGWWYPDKRRAFVVPVAHADALADAIRAAARGEASDPPDFIQHRDEVRDYRIDKLRELGAPPDMLEHLQRHALRAVGLSDRE